MRSRSRWVVIGGAAAAALAPLGVIAGSLTDVPAIPGGGVVIGAQDGAGEGRGPESGSGANGTDAKQLPTREAEDAASGTEGDGAAASGDRLTAQQHSQQRTESPRAPTDSSRRTASPAPPKSTTATSHTDDDDDNDDDDSHVVSPASPISADSPDEDD